MSQDQKKRNAAKVAIDYIKNNAIIGVGTGSTINFFIEELAKNKGFIDGAVSSSVATDKLLKEYNIPILFAPPIPKFSEVRTQDTLS